MGEPLTLEREGREIAGRVAGTCIDAAMHLHYHFRPHALSVIGACHARRPGSRIHADRPLPDHGSGDRPPALGLGKRDKIRYRIRPGGEVVLTRVATDEAADPVIGQFLGFLARDMASHPDRLRSVDADLLHRIQSLVGGVEVDLDTPLTADDE